MFCAPTFGDYNPTFGHLFASLQFMAIIIILSLISSARSDLPLIDELTQSPKLI